jgi:hypothetical protein
MISDFGHPTHTIVQSSKHLEISDMPTISMFYGIVIRLFLGKKEHNPPHFHAYYQILYVWGAMETKLTLKLDQKVIQDVKV